MDPATAKPADKAAIEETSILFFDCCLALDLALRTARGLARQPTAAELKPQLEDLMRLLEICDGRLTLLTEQLDIAFYVHNGELD